MTFVTCPVCKAERIPVGAGGQMQAHNKPNDGVQRYGKLKECANRDPRVRP